MQKLINALAIISFVGVAGIVGAGYCLYQNKDSIIQELLPIPGGLDDMDLPSPSLEGTVPSATPLPAIPTPSI